MKRKTEKPKSRAQSQRVETGDEWPTPTQISSQDNAMQRQTAGPVGLVRRRSQSRSDGFTRRSTASGSTTEEKHSDGRSTNRLAKGGSRQDTEIRNKINVKRTCSDQRSKGKCRLKKKTGARNESINSHEQGKKKPSVTRANGCLSKVKKKVHSFFFLRLVRREKGARPAAALDSATGPRLSDGQTP